MTLHGIDISHWQSGLQLAKTDAQFAIMKATDGTSYVDAACNGFVNQAKAAGLLWGVYHFAQNTGNLNAEADHFIESVRGYLGHGILVLDWEAGNLGNVAGAKAWLDRVHAKTGIRPLIYMSQSVAAGHNWSSVKTDYALWVARYGAEIGSTGGWPVTMWQYTNAHPTGGMKVDGDRFYGTNKTWKAFATGHPQADDDTAHDDQGDDDMPNPKGVSYGADYDLPANGKWHGLRINDDPDVSDYSLLMGPKLATGTLFVQVQADKGTEVRVKSVHVDTKPGADSKVAYDGYIQETITAGGTTQIVYPFTENVHKAAADGWSRKLRFQILAAGGGNIAVVSAHVRTLYWDK